jgi:exopolysaccharide biosynthesis polyprenyl glycosylphosphotransferase
MALKLAVLEALVVFGAVCAAATVGTPRALGLSNVGWHALVFALCSVTAFERCALYDVHQARSSRRSAPRLVLAMGGVLALLALAHGLPDGCPVPPFALAVALPGAAVALLAVRSAYARLARRRLVERVVILGGGALAERLVEVIEAREDLPERVLGTVPETAPAGWQRRHLGVLRDLDRIVERVRPDRVVVALASRRGHMPFKTLLGLRLRGVAVEDGVDCYERLTGKVPIEALTPTNLIFGRHSGPRRIEHAITWSLGLMVALLGLVALAPLFALAALAIRLDSRGPVLFVQPRVGRGGRVFSLVKFRTMHPAANVPSEWARDNERRLTRVGRWLRKFRLDELPQLLNIARGDMNWVGPRPHPASNLAMLVLVARNTPECGEPIPFYALRSLVRPGLTGWAQVRYRYANDLDEEIEKLRYDLHYIKHRSFWLDLRILVETVTVVLRGRESAPAAPRERAALALPDAMGAPELA